MKKNYINPQTELTCLDEEAMLAVSENLERGYGGGGNNAEVKREISFTDLSDDKIWD